MKRLGTSFTAIATALVVAAAVLLAVSPAQAHGYVSGAVVARVAAPQNTGLGAVAYEPQSLEAPKGFPQSGPADGKLASAGGLFGGVLDQQTSDRWYKNPITTGPLMLSWTFTAPHKTSEWRYYITKPGWNPNAPLTRSEFTLLATVPHDGSAASSNPNHTITIPADYRGYHVIYAVWDIADTSNAFYNVIDVQISGAGSSPSSVSPPTGLHSMATTTSSVQLMWTASANAIGYLIERVAPNGTVTTATTTSTMYTDSGLAASTSYTYRVYATAGSARSSAVTFSATTAQGSGTSPVAPVTGLHAMERSSTTVQLMWTASTGATSYRIERTAPDGSTVTRTTTGTMYDDSGLRASTTYIYSVTAVAADGRTSAPVSLMVTTDAAPTTPTVPGTYPAWSASASYAKGDRVTYQGAAYEAVQPYRGVGDPTWITAQSLWRPVVSAGTGTPTPTPQPTSTPSPSPTPTPTSTPKPTSSPSTALPWNPSGTYAKGALVTYGGATYRAVQNVRGWGDPSWITAPSLWQLI